jgi:phosphatidylserine decarboxylase
VLTTLPPQTVSLDKGAELGRFNMGSTVILLFQSNRARLNPDVRPGLQVRVGESLGLVQ